MTSSVDLSSSFPSEVRTHVHMHADGRTGGRGEGRVVVGVGDVGQRGGTRLVAACVCFLACWVCDRVVSDCVCACVRREVSGAADSGNTVVGPFAERHHGRRD